MLAAQIENNLVINVIETDSLDILPNLVEIVKVDGLYQGGIGWIYNNGVFTPPPQIEPTAAENQSTAQSLLIQTDWSELQDVSNPNNTPHLLNQPEFIVYREQIRQIIVNPVAGNLNFPTQPIAQWS